MKITGLNNETVKETAKLQQKKYRNDLFLLEGEKCIQEAINSGLKIVRLFHTEKENIFEKYENIDFIETTDAVLKKISTTTTPPKYVAVANKIKPVWNNDFKRVLLLEGIKDAGNLGSIIRSAMAFSFDAIILYGDTVDMYNPKCIRATVGNLWKLPIFEINNFEDIQNQFSDFTRIATLPKSNNSDWLRDFSFDDKILLMFGSEADGLSNELKNYATKNLTIEMNKNVESLNLGISASIIMYKIFEKSF